MLLSISKTLLPLYYWKNECSELEISEDEFDSVKLRQEGAQHSVHPTSGILPGLWHDLVRDRMGVLQMVWLEEHVIGFFLAASLFRFMSLFSSHPLAGNAHRWAAQSMRNRGFQC